MWELFKAFASVLSWALYLIFSLGGLWMAYQGWTSKSFISEERYYRKAGVALLLALIFRLSI